MEIGGINHIGVAVPSIEDFLRRNDAVYSGFSRGPVIVNQTQAIKEMFITDGKTVLELLEPLHENSPLAGYLKKNPQGGLIHVAFDVDHLESAIERVKKAGGRVVVDPVPDIAFQQRRIAFAYLGGHVYEFIEKERKHG